MPGKAGRSALGELIIDRLQIIAVQLPIIDDGVILQCRFRQGLPEADNILPYSRAGPELPDAAAFQERRCGFVRRHGNTAAGEPFVDAVRPSGQQMIFLEPSLQLVILKYDVHNGRIPVDVSSRVAVVPDASVPLFNACHGGHLLTPWSCLRSRAHPARSAPSAFPAPNWAYIRPLARR